MRLAQSQGKAPGVRFRGADTTEGSSALATVGSAEPRARMRRSGGRGSRRRTAQRARSGPSRCHQPPGNAAMRPASSRSRSVSAWPKSSPGGWMTTGRSSTSRSVPSSGSRSPPPVPIRRPSCSARSTGPRRRRSPRESVSRSTIATAASAPGGATREATGCRRTRWRRRPAARSFALRPAIGSRTSRRHGSRPAKDDRPRFRAQALRYTSSAPQSFQASAIHSASSAVRGVTVITIPPSSIAVR